MRLRIDEQLTTHGMVDLAINRSFDGKGQRLLGEPSAS